MKLILQSLVIISSFVFVFIWQKLSLSDYTIPLLGFFIFIYLVLYSRKKNIGAHFGEKGSIFVLNTVIFLLIFSTGGLSSSMLTFLIYFLGFGIAFAFEPAAVFVFMLCTLLLFAPEAFRNDPARNLIILGSLILISPLAFFFGKEYRKSDAREQKIQKLKEETREAAEIITEDVDEVLKKEKRGLKEETVEKLDEILEETEMLREESKK